MSVWLKSQKIAENWGFMPYSESKNAKNGGFLRVCGRKMVGGAVKKPKNPPGWVIIIDIILKYAKLQLVVAKDENMFSQDYKLNIRTCDGCACRCSLGAVEKDKGSGVFYPVINGRMISNWTDADGKLQNWGDYVHQNRLPAAALARARQIAKVCDYYETGLMPVYGSVKCTLCDLPNSKKCVLNWVRAKDNSFYASIGGECCRFGAVPVDAMYVDSKGVSAETVGDALNKLRIHIIQHCGKINSH